MEITLDSGDRFCYVPVLESLGRLLNDEFILAEVKYHVFSVQNKLITAMFYYLLGNDRPRYRSQLKAIQLAAVVNISIIDSNGIDAILAPLVDDIKKLENV